MLGDGDGCVCVQREDNGALKFLVVDTLCSVEKHLCLTRLQHEGCTHITTAVRVEYVSRIVKEVSRCASPRCCESRWELTDCLKVNKLNIGQLF